MSLKIFQILCVAYLNILPVLVNDKKNISKYFHVDWRLDIFRFWLHLAGGLIVVSEDSRGAAAAAAAASGGGRREDTRVTTSPVQSAVLQHRQSGQHQPPANILHQTSSPSSARQSLAHLVVAWSPCLPVLLVRTEGRRGETVVKCVRPSPASVTLHQINSKETTEH